MQTIRFLVYGVIAVLTVILASGVLNDASSFFRDLSSGRWHLISAAVMLVTAQVVIWPEIKAKYVGNNVARHRPALSLLVEDAARIREFGTNARDGNDESFVDQAERWHRRVLDTLDAVGGGYRARLDIHDGLVPESQSMRVSWSPERMDWINHLSLDRQRIDAFISEIQARAG